MLNIAQSTLLTSIRVMSLTFSSCDSMLHNRILRCVVAVQYFEQSNYCVFDKISLIIYFVRNFSELK